MLDKFVEIYHLDSNGVSILNRTNLLANHVINITNKILNTYDISKAAKILKSLSNIDGFVLKRIDPDLLIKNMS